ncbi:hypothetical protein, variant [Cryptococcus amylolentus CBS 6039]|uniref:Uncharacterized protein n=2 Tax=Cryptococcus amylolentus TaxID=104669 RepID=A0A1E3HYZ3_9TREE|nr:hypothetical protein L202_01976 [Cryptococcus amylolentus CBS 6039]XP_018995879.1 hypothetical protein, variant [Cryptococcus amylolentus CBS 6039]ODN81559.1 hypothetical protein L202_01976 [Cryptococcus amylolentus CBS 6039]ODN81560.1 hypothetical protein, variant [Cryptococcus amylolentus CBS 6039]ODO10214.1 hypothetical protein I350_02443 [Cryptococcus amylolentus CBS 6273]
MLCSCIDTPIISGDITSLSRFPPEVKSHIFACLMADLCQSHFAKLIHLSRTIYLHNVSALYDEVILSDENVYGFFEGLYDFRPYTPVIPKKCDIITSASYPVPHKLRLIQGCRAFYIESGSTLSCVLNDIKREWRDSAPWMDEARLGLAHASLPTLSIRPEMRPPHRLFAGTEKLSLSAATTSSILEDGDLWISRFNSGSIYNGWWDDGTSRSYPRITLDLPPGITFPPSPEHMLLFSSLFRARSDISNVTLLNVELGDRTWDGWETAVHHLECVLPSGSDMSEEERIGKVVKFYEAFRDGYYEDYTFVSVPPRYISIENLAGLPRRATKHNPSSPAQHTPVERQNQSIIDRTHAAILDAFPSYDRKDSNFRLGQISLEPEFNHSPTLGKDVKKSIKWLETEREFVSEAYIEKKRRLELNPMLWACEDYSEVEKGLAKIPMMEKRMVVEKVCPWTSV